MILLIYYFHLNCFRHEKTQIPFSLILSEQLILRSSYWISRGVLLGDEDGREGGLRRSRRILSLSLSLLCWSGNTMGTSKSNMPSPWAGLCSSLSLNHLIAITDKLHTWKLNAKELLVSLPSWHLEHVALISYTNMGRLVARS